jgi:uncharacterized membrane protein
MSLLVLGVVLLAGLHLIAAVPSQKQRLRQAVGAAAYGPVFGGASVVALAIIVLGWRMAPFVPVYDPPSWGWIANFALTLVAFICLGIFLFRGRLRQTLRFPMGIAAIFWATGHLFANGDLASLILFGGMLVYAAAHIAIGMANGVRPTPEVRQGHDLLSILAGIALYGVMAQIHGAVIGVPVFSITP